ncbi:mucoidy inhibitor MuiA family protein [Pedobacter sp. HMF7647]|uniref:Mucoidy inhibitor MuiA family protein n=1 Tax=Hufsiella arboris TaxID=2695275 RepID=A0A7K1YEQ9_9SPHI|nr:mucoidy inhibitor MuiA family protein [Hufsiella arboris]MXV52890.1 mucoidy inhibitor MuiA family protein [Hufsiella arboris]
MEKLSNLLQASFSHKILNFNAKLLSALILIFVVSGVSAQEKISLQSKISRVIVFLKGAQVERIAQASISAGNSVILLKGLSPEIEEQSIQVKGMGNFVILSVNKQANFLNEQKEDAETKKQEDAADAIRDKIEIRQNDLAILKKEEDMLAQNQRVGSDAAGLDLNKLKQALDFQKARLADNKLKQLQIRKELNKLNDELADVNKQLADLKGKGKSNTSDIAITISSKAAGSANFQVSYLVKNATWFPTYDIRATDISKPIELVYRANVSQQCGEEWNNVNLALSSGDPSQGGNRPVLNPYKIGYNVFNYKPSETITNVYGHISDASDGSALPGVSVRIKGTSIGAASDASGNYTIQIPSPASVLEYNYVGYEKIERPAVSTRVDVRMQQNTQALNEVVAVGYSQKSDITGSVQRVVSGVKIRGVSSVPQASAVEVQVQQSQTTVQFEVKQPYTISSDGKQLSVEVAKSELPASFRYYAVPKLSQQAYLTAAITGVNDLNLLSGEATIFFEGAFLGKTLIDMSNTGDTLNVSLGADKGVTVKRTQQLDKNSRTFAGSNARAERAYLLEVYNHKSQAIQLTLEDQLPVSNSSEVTVEKQEISGASLEEQSGRLTWNLDLKPNERKTETLRYQVKYPRNKPVILE